MLSSAIFLIFSIFKKFFVFLQKKISSCVVVWKQIFLRSNVIFHSFYSKIATLTILFKIILFFAKKPKFCTFLEILFQSHFTANFLYFGDKKITKSELDISAGHFQLTLATKHKKARVEWMMLLFNQNFGKKTTHETFGGLP